MEASVFGVRKCLCKPKDFKVKVCIISKLFVEIFLMQLKISVYFLHIMQKLQKEGRE